MQPDGDSPDLDRLAGEEISESACRDVLHRFPERRGALLQVRRLPEPILSVLAADPDFKVRRAVAQHPGIDAEVISQLSTDTYPGVRLMLACNPVTDAETLGRMVRDDPWPDLRKIGSKQLALAHSDWSTLL